MVGPVVGFAAFLGWVGWRYGDVLAPLKVQEQGSHRGGVADPFRTLAHDASLLVHDRHLGEALHLPWVLLAVALLVVAVRRWPAAYSAYAAAVLVVALTASNLDGFERYALSAFPLVLAGATVTSSRRGRAGGAARGRGRTGPVRPSGLHQPVHPLTRGFACPGRPATGAGRRVRGAYARDERRSSR